MKKAIALLLLLSLTGCYVKHENDIILICQITVHSFEIYLVRLKARVESAEDRAYSAELRNHEIRLGAQAAVDEFKKTKNHKLLLKRMKQIAGGD